MDELVAFVRRCLDDDERVARQVMAEPGGFYLESETEDTNIMTIGAHVYRWTPKRVLAEVAAKRRILDLHRPDAHGYCPTCDDNTTEAPCLTVSLLAQPFAGREGWREEWRA